MTDTARLQSALAYARELGWAVFPLHSVEEAGRCSCHRGADCERAGKHPRTREGLKEATTEARTLRSWWVQWPDANLAVATGPGSGIDVLDVDPRHGGDDSLETLEAEYGPLPATAEQHTGGGGRHLVFQHHEGVRNKAGLAPGLDVRGEGGYVVVPPSTHASGRSYVWELSSRPGQVGLAAWPPWLLEQILSGRDQGEGAERLAPLAETIPAGERNETLFRHACKMRRQGLSPAGIRAALTVENERCDPPLPEAEIDDIAGSAARYTPSGGNGHPPADKRSALPGGNGHPPAAPGSPPTPVAPGFLTTDMGNAQRLVARHGPALRHCHDWRTWLIWDGRRWEKDRVGAVEYQAKQTVRSIYQEARQEPDEARAKALAQHAFRSQNKTRLEAMATLARSEPDIPVRPEELDTAPWLLNVRNGILDLQTGALGPHRPEALITRLAPVPYEPHATCPGWLAFLERIMAGNEGLIAFLQRAIGYALTGSTRAQVMCILYGEGSNGKSTFLETVHHLLGDYAQQSDAATFAVQKGEGPRNDVARLMGSRLVSAVETEEGQRLSEVLVKQVTGGDTITARFLHQEFFQFKPEFKLFLATNHKPQIWGTDHAIWRRIRLIPFTVKIPDEEQDQELPDRLLEELPGILAWAVRGCQQWQEKGLGEPEAVREATGEYREEMDLLGGFLAECCRQAPNSEARAGDLYQAYLTWCQENGEREVTQTTFGRKLGERGFKKRRSTGGKRVYSGLELGTLVTPLTSSDPVQGKVHRDLVHKGNLGKGTSPPVIPSLPREDEPERDVTDGYERGTL